MAESAPVDDSGFCSDWHVPTRQTTARNDGDRAVGTKPGVVHLRSPAPAFTTALRPPHQTDRCTLEQGGVAGFETGLGGERRAPRSGWWMCRIGRPVCGWRYTLLSERGITPEGRVGCPVVALGTMRCLNRL
jgi:hypothetical protein